MKSKWTEQRLERLFGRYNQNYFSGKLRRYAVHIRKLEGYVGFIDYGKREILIDVEEHESDPGIRATLLHEMTHESAGKNGHGYRFWAETEKLLRQKAPIDVGMSEAPGLRMLSGVVPRKFPLARNALDKVETARQRHFASASWNKFPTHEVTENEIIGDFRDAALELTESQAVQFIGREYGTD